LTEHGRNVSKCKIAESLIERGWPRNLRLPQLRSGHRLLGSYPKTGVMSGLATTRDRLQPYTVFHSRDPGSAERMRPLHTATGIREIVPVHAFEW
jgi:hypothetical protein